MKTALGAEIREFASQPLSTHRGCVALATARSGFPIQRLEDLGRFPEPVIYPNSVARLGLIGDEAHWVVDFFARIQHFRQGIVVMRRLPLPDSIAPINAEPSANALLDACEAAVFVLPALRDGDLYRMQDEKFSAAVATARAEWKPEQKLNRNLEKGRG